MEMSKKKPYPPEYMEMERIEELLKCGICHDFIETAVMTPCSHNYCSLCIRKYLHYKTQCPACFQTTFEKDLRTNRILDEMIIHHVKILAKLVGYNTGADKDATNDNCYEESSENLSSTKSHFITKTRTENVTLSSSVLCASSRTSDKTNDCFSNDCQLNNEEVSCPICLVQISITHINRHLDECIKRETIQKECLPRFDHTRKLLPKLVFNLMKDSELKKKMKQLNLPTQGDRRTLENRFQRYCTLYNAESDKKNPRPIEALLEQCKTEELIERKLGKSPSEINSFKTLRNAEQSVIDEANEKYLKMNDRSYQNLIECIKSREKHRQSNNKAKSNEKTLICMHNTEHVRTCSQPLLLQCDPMISDHANQNSSESLTINSSKQKTIIKTNVIMSNAPDPIEKIEAGMTAHGNRTDEKLRNIDEDGKCSSINGSIATYRAIENRELHVLEKDIDNQTICRNTLDRQRRAPLPNEISQHNEYIDINYTDNSSECLKSIDSTIKRRRRQNCAQSTVKTSSAMYAKT